MVEGCTKYNVQGTKYELRNTGSEQSTKYGVGFLFGSYFVLCTWYLVHGTTKKALRSESKGFNNVAATYSPGCNPSTIGAAGLNFSVRDGKRWDPCARPPKL